MCYAHVVDATLLTPIWCDINESDRDDFRLIREDPCRSIACHLNLAPPVITHGVDYMVR